MPSLIGYSDRMRTLRPHAEPLPVWCADGSCMYLLYYLECGGVRRCRENVQYCGAVRRYAESEDATRVPNRTVNIIGSAGLEGTLPQALGQELSENCSILRPGHNESLESAHCCASLPCQRSPDRRITDARDKHYQDT